MFSPTKRAVSPAQGVLATVRCSDSGRRLKVLVLDEEIPYPPNSGKRIRTWNLLRSLARRHDISLLCYGDANDSAAEALREAGIRLHLVQPKAHATGWGLYFQLFVNLFSTLPFSVTKHYSRGFHAKFRALLGQECWDLIQCEWTPYARFVSDVCRVPVFVSTHNVECQILERRKHTAKNLIAKIFFWMQEQKMRRFERHALAHASGAAAVTTVDIGTMRNWGINNIALIPNGVDLDSFGAGLDREREGEILFLASLDWHPNIDALQYFTNEILPLLRARRPQIRLRIVGRRPSEALKNQFLGIPDVDFTGEVENVLPYLGRAAVFVVPLRIGGGSRIKILEALAAGKAVVSTSIGAEGLHLISGKHLLIGDSPREFAQCVEQLLASKDLRKQLGEQGRLLVNDRYGWEGIAAELEKAWFRTSTRRPGAQANYSRRQEVHATP
jgi:polysaccharide biosynthesis protein PslH